MDGAVVAIAEPQPKPPRRISDAPSARNLKPRHVSAVRRWPPGCGRFPPLPPQPPTPSDQSQPPPSPPPSPPSLPLPSCSSSVSLTPTTPTSTTTNTLVSDSNAAPADSPPPPPAEGKIDNIPVTNEKPPVVITRESESAMHPVILELAAGSDIVASMSDFSLRRRTAVSVLSGTGSVSNVTIRHSSSPSSNVILHGRFDLLSLSGTILLPTSSSSNSPNKGFSILMCGPQGQVIGGTVAGPLMAADTVMILAALYSAPEIHHLPFPVENEEADVAVAAMAEREVEGRETVQAPPLYGRPVRMRRQMARPEMALWFQPPPSSRAGQNTSQY